MSASLPFSSELPHHLHSWVLHRLALSPRQAEPEPVVAKDVSRGLLFALACLIGIGLWNAIETLVLIWWSFNNRHNLYFWSIIAAALGTLLCVSSQVMNLGTVNPNTTAILTVGSTGWVPMVTGQSLVLYSRLHLLWDNKRTLRLILAMIITNCLIFQGSVIGVCVPFSLAPVFFNILYLSPQCEESSLLSKQKEMNKKKERGRGRISHRKWTIRAEKEEIPQT